MPKPIAKARAKRRRGLLTLKLIDSIVAGVKGKVPYTVVCRALGVPRETSIEWRSKGAEIHVHSLANHGEFPDHADPEYISLVFHLHKQCEREEAKAVGALSQLAYTFAQGDPATLRWLLERLEPSTYSKAKPVAEVAAGGAGSLAPNVQVYVPANPRGPGRAGETTDGR